MVVEDDDEDVSEVVQPEQRNKGKDKATVPPSINGKPPSRGKGKGKAGSTTNGHKKGSNLVVVEELDDDEPPVAKSPIPSTKGKRRTISPDLVEEGEIVASLEEFSRTKAEQNVVRFSPRLNQRFGISNDLCCAVQSQERGTV
jgi:hypothetical protein